MAASVAAVRLSRVKPQGSQGALRAQVGAETAGEERDGAVLRLHVALEGGEADLSALRPASQTPHTDHFQLLQLFLSPTCLKLLSFSAVSLIGTLEAAAFPPAHVRR